MPVLTGTESKPISTVIVLALLGLFLAGPAVALPSRCRRTTEFTTDTSTEISARPGIVCSVHLLATSADAWGLVFDSPVNTGQQAVEHGQIRRIAEPGVATSGNSVSHFFGDEGQATDFGIGAFVVRGRLIVNWDA